MLTPNDLARRAAGVLTRLRERRPRVHCITNAVAQSFTANMLLAAGAVPSMTMAPDEVGDFTARSDALLINLGTLDDLRRQAIDIAISTATEAGLPWLLDPVFVDRSRGRCRFAQGLLSRRPAAVRLNHAELSALAGSETGETDLLAFARCNGVVVGLTGEVDQVTDGGRHCRIHNGHALMARVTAMGCAGSALGAACLAVEEDAFIASVAGLLMLGISGEIAAERACGPGSFASAVLDVVYNLDCDLIVERARTTA